MMPGCSAANRGILHLLRRSAVSLRGWVGGVQKCTLFEVSFDHFTENGRTVNICLGLRHNSMDTTDRRSLQYGQRDALSSVLAVTGEMSSFQAYMVTGTCTCRLGMGWVRKPPSGCPKSAVARDGSNVTRQWRNGVIICQREGVDYNRLFRNNRMTCAATK